MAKPFKLADLTEGLAGLLPPAEGSSYVPHTPHERQQAFLDDDRLELLYGGQAGGGKSDALLMAAMQYVHIPGYAALILRRTFRDLSLPGAIMDRAKSWLAGSAADWDEEAKTFTFPGGGRLSFGYLQTDKDRFRYASAEFQFIGFDELTQFPVLWYKFLASRLRKPAEGRLAHVPLRLRGGSNPGGIGHEWVRRRFINPESVESVIDGEEGEVPGFIPATLDDNPFVNAKAYRTALQILDVQTRKQLEEGVWTTDQSTLVFRYNEHLNFFGNGMPELDRFVLGVDFGYNDSCAFVELGWSEKSRRVYVTRVHRQEKMTPSDAAEFVRGWMSRRSYDRIVADVGGLGKGYAEEGRKRFQIPYEPAQKTDKRGYINLLNGALERGELQVCGGAEALLGEWRELPWNEARSDYQVGFLDHLSDACLYGWREAAGWTVALPAEAPLETEAARMAREEAELEAEVTSIARSWRRRGRQGWAKELLKKNSGL